MNDESLGLLVWARCPDSVAHTKVRVACWCFTVVRRPPGLVLAGFGQPVAQVSGCQVRGHARGNAPGIEPPKGFPLSLCPSFPFVLSMAQYISFPLSSTQDILALRYRYALGAKNTHHRGHQDIQGSRRTYVHTITQFVLSLGRIKAYAMSVSDFPLSRHSSLSRPPLLSLPVAALESTTLVAPTPR